jgi:ABC-type glycerol-3-phosphate transport system permease component
MFFSGGLIPTYLLVRSLGMLDTRLALVIPNALGVFYVIVARTFFSTSIPVELSEAAEMEGASDLRFLASIALPLSGPLVAVLALFYAVGHWNAYFEALIYLRSPRLYPLQLYLQDVLIRSQGDPLMRGSANIREAEQTQYLAELVKYSLIVVANLPILLLYPFIQRHFVKGALIGSIKG